MPSSAVLRSVLTLGLGAVAAAACEWARVPLPWMIGPLVATAAFGMAGVPVAASATLRNLGQAVIGAALGLYFTPQVLALVAANALAIGAGIVWAVALGLAFSAFLARSNRGRAGLDRVTAFFAGAIGGASEMAMLAERHGARVDLVAAAHSMRLLLVVVIVPFAFQWSGLQGLDPSLPGPQGVDPRGLAVLAALVGAGVGALVLLRLPNPWLLGPLAVAFALTVGGVELSAVPKALSNAAQLVIGVALGTRFTPAFWHTAPRWLATVAAGTVAMIAASAAFAWALAWASGLHPATLMLGTSPGGIAEMCITAKVLQLGVPVVTAFHVTRLAAVLLLAEPLARRFGRTQVASRGAG